MEFGPFDHRDWNDLLLDEFYETRLDLMEASQKVAFYARHFVVIRDTPAKKKGSPALYQTVEQGELLRDLTDSLKKEFIP